MIFSVLIPMLLGPMIGNFINAAANIPLPLVDATGNENSALMTTEYIPAPEIFLAGAICAALMFVLIPLLVKVVSKRKKTEEVNG